MEGKNKICLSFIILLVLCGKKVKEDVEITSESFTIRYLGKDVLRSGRIKFLKVNVSVEQILGGYFKFKEEVSKASYAKLFKTGEVQSEIGTARLRIRREGEVTIISVEKLEGDFNRVELEFDCFDDEHFLGLGEWFDSVDARGKVRRIWTQEGHISRGEGEDKAFPIWEFTTYFPAPYFLSTRFYAFMLKTTSMSIFDMCRDETWKVQVDDTDFEIVLIHGERPLDIILKFTELEGIPPVPPKWAFSPWIDSIKGQDRVLSEAEFIRENKIPCSVIWTEDWRGGREMGFGVYTIGGWGKEPDRSLYSDIEELAGKLNSMGFKFLAYFNTFLVKGREEYEEAFRKGYLVRTTSGIFHAVAPEGEAALLDLTNPSAREWMKGIMRKIADLGFSGWMADFGEWLPYNAQLYDGRWGAEAHNEYPILWQELNKEFWDEYTHTGDYIFFTRSGYIGTQGLSPVVWPGDQNTDWMFSDGLPSVIPAGISAGIMGVVMFGPDIAGYTSLPGLMPTSTKELYIRWTQQGAFSPVMRTHHGVMPEDNWRYNKDKETLEIFKKYAEIHSKLFPYLYSYAKRREPIIRHVFVEFPEVVDIMDERMEGWEGSWLDYEYMLGEYMLIAPVVKEGATRRKLYLPEGSWYDFFSDKRFEGGKFVEVSAPLQKIPVFIRGIIPLLASAPDTFVEVDEHDIETLDEGHLVLLITPGTWRFDLYDGTLIETQPSPCGKKIVEAEGDNIEVNVGCLKVRISGRERKYTIRAL